MKKIRQSIIMLLSLMVFITSSGMAVNLHYCAGELQNISINAQTEGGCAMQTAPFKKDACSQQNVVKKKDTCCQDQHIKAKTDQSINQTKVKTEKKNNNSFTFISEYFSSLFNFSDSEQADDDEENKDLSIFPLLKSGLHILLQNFHN